jgi:hypothetical protein
MTATAQQAMQCYVQIQFSSEEGVTAFHYELMLWAGQLAQYPDKYSFKRRLINRLPSEYWQHLKLYDDIAAEHSSIDNIVLKAQYLERTLISMRSGCRIERYSAQSPATPIAGPLQRAVAPCERQHTCNALVRQLQLRTNANARAQAQQPAQWPIAGGHGFTAVLPLAMKGDTLKYTCYRCSKMGHIASDLKCPQHKKPEL